MITCNSVLGQIILFCVITGQSVKTNLPYKPLKLKNSTIQIEVGERRVTMNDTEPPRPDVQEVAQGSENLATTLEDQHNHDASVSQSVRAAFLLKKIITMLLFCTYHVKR